MAYHSRIVADPAYLQALGQALYNFTYLEWVAVWTIVKLSSDAFGSVPVGKTALKIARALSKAIGRTSPPLPNDLRRRLVKFNEAYRSAIRNRNKLIHAHPYTTTSGLQQLGSSGHEWPIDEVDASAKLFEDAAIMGNDIFHGDLASARP
jgi:hypothetical protein